MMSGDTAPKTIMSRASREPKLAIGGSSRLVQMQIKTHSEEKPKKDKTTERLGRHDKEYHVPPPPKPEKRTTLANGLKGLHLDNRDGVSSESSSGDINRVDCES